MGGAEHEGPPVPCARPWGFGKALHAQAQHLSLRSRVSVPAAVVLTISTAMDPSMTLAPEQELLKKHADDAAQAEEVDQVGLRRD